MTTDTNAPVPQNTTTNPPATAGNPANPAQSEGVTPAQAEAAAVKKWKLKVDKEEIEVDENEFTALAQKGKFADKISQEAAKIKREFERMRKQMEEDEQNLNSLFAQEDFLERIEKAGVDPRKAIEYYIKRLTDDASMTDEQKELRALKEEKSAREKAEQERISKETEVKIAAKQKEYQKQLETDMTSALNKAGLPKTPLTVKKIAHFMEIAIQQGYKDVTVEKVLPLVKQELCCLSWNMTSECSKIRSEEKSDEHPRT